MAWALLVLGFIAHEHYVGTLKLLILDIHVVLFIGINVLSAYFKRLFIAIYYYLSSYITKYL